MAIFTVFSVILLILSRKFTGTHSKVHKMPILTEKKSSLRLLLAGNSGIECRPLNEADRLFSRG